MKTVEVIQAYRCPFCKALHGDTVSAEKCRRRCYREDLARRRAEEIQKNRESLSNRPRLEAESFEHAWELVKKHALDLMGLRFILESKVSDLGFGRISNTHSAPVGGKTNWWQKGEDGPKSYLGWGGMISGKVSIAKLIVKKSGRVSLHSVMGGPSLSDYNVGFTFTGFHTGTGCPGDKFDIGFSAFIDDFPLIKNKYKELCLASRLSGKKLVDPEFNGIYAPEELLPDQG